MQLQLKPGKQGGGKPCGILIRGSEPEAWLRAIKGSGILLAATKAYAIPGSVAASVWGCLSSTGIG